MSRNINYRLILLQKKFSFLIKKKSMLKIQDFDKLFYFSRDKYIRFLRPIFHLKFCHVSPVNADTFLLRPLISGANRDPQDLRSYVSTM